MYPYPLPSKQFLFRRLITLAMVVLPKMLVAQNITEPFNGTALPPGWTLRAGAATVGGGKLGLINGCLELPNTYSRVAGLTIEFDATLRNPNDDVNVWALYDNVTCGYGPVNGYSANWYPAGGDNITDSIAVFTNSAAIDLTVRSASITTNRQARVKMEFLANGVINSYIDNTLILTTVNQKWSTGKLALQSLGVVDIDNVVVMVPSSARSFLISFTGFGDSPCILSAFPGCSEYPSAPPENGRGMTTLINNVEGLPELATLLKRAFTFFTHGHGSANLPPNDESPHAEAEAWLRAQNLRAQDKLMIVGHSYGGNRARLFAAQIYGALGRRTDTLVLVDPIDWIKCGGTAFSLARFTIGLINVGPCDQQSDSFPIPVGVDNAVVYRQAVDVGLDRALAGYTLASATSLNLTHPHMEIDDAETVHREIINRLMPNLLARPAVRLRVKSTLVTAERVDGFAVGYRVTLIVENTGKLIATNVKLTQFELGGVSPTIFPKFEVIMPGASASVSTLLTGLSLSPGRTVRFSMRGLHNPETNGLPFGVDLKTVYLPSVPTL